MYKLSAASVLLALMLLLDPVSAKAVSATLGYNIFCLPDAANKKLDAAYIELFWEIDPRSLHYKKNTEGLLLSYVRTEIEIKKGTKVVYSNAYQLGTNPSTVEETSRQKIMELLRVRLDTGAYTVSIRLKEPDFEPQALLTEDFTVSLPIEEVVYSSIQLLDTFYNNPGVKESVFLKNDILQIPLYTNFIDDNRKNLHYNLELYQAKDLPVASYPLIATVYISKKDGGAPVNLLYRNDTLTKKLVQPLYGTLSTATLSSGNYYLVAELKDILGNNLDKKSIFFQVLNKDPEAFKAPMLQERPADSSVSDSSVKPADQNTLNFVDLSKTFIARYSMAQVRAILKMLMPVATPLEHNTITNFLDKPDDLYMRYFIYNFFVAKNRKNPEQAWKEYSDKVREVNKLFGGGTKPGYETDRGYTYLKYGKPDELINVEYEQGSQPYEIWQYFAAGERKQPAVFLFYRPSFMMGDYRLLHSTLPGEVRNLNWRAELYKGRTATDIETKAEQYLGTERR